MLSSLLFACVLRTSSPTTAPADQQPVLFGPLEEKVNLLLGESSDEDQRTRLMQARELMFSMRAKDPTVQKVVYDYLAQVIAVEERVRPQLVAEMAFADEGSPVAEIDLQMGAVQETSLDTPPVTPVGTPVDAPVDEGGGDPPPIDSPASDPTAVVTSPDLERARTLLAEGRYAESADLLAGAQDPVSKGIRKEAVDGWARSERERAGQLFIEARKLPPGADRDAAVVKVKEILAGVNARYPDNAYAAQITQHISRVETEVGGR